MRLIDAEKLIAEIEKRQEELSDHNFHSMAEEYDNILDIIASLQQEQPEAQNGKFVFPKYLYARTKDNKTIDMSYASQDMTAVEYIRNDFVEQEQSENKEKIMNFFDAIGDCGFSQHDILLLKNIWKEAGCPPPKSQIADASKMGQPEVDLDFRVFGKEMDAVFNLPKEVTENTEENPLNWEYAIARHFYELGLNARKEESVSVAESPSKTFPRVNEFDCGGSYRH